MAIGAFRATTIRSCACIRVPPPNTGHDPISGGYLRCLQWCAHLAVRLVLTSVNPPDDDPMTPNTKGNCSPTCLDAARQNYQSPRLLSLYSTASSNGPRVGLLYGKSVLSDAAQSLTVTVGPVGVPQGSIESRVNPDLFASRVPARASRAVLNISLIWKMKKLVGGRELGATFPKRKIFRGRN